MNAAVHTNVYAYVADALTPAEHEDFAAHLATCADCRREVAGLREVTAQMSGLVAAEPSESVRSSVLASIATTPQDAAEPTRTGVPHPANPWLDNRVSHDAGDELAPVISIRRSFGVRAAGLVAAAAVAVALAVGGWAVETQQTARQAAAQTQQLTRLLGSSDVRIASGTFTNGGTGTVVTSARSHQAMLVASGLPALPDGKVYEAWTIQKEAVPAGTFSPSASSSVVPLPRSAFTAKIVAVTVEPAGGSLQPTTPAIFTVSAPAS